MCLTEIKKSAHSPIYVKLFFFGKYKVAKKWDFFEPFGNFIIAVNALGINGYAAINKLVNYVFDFLEIFGGINRVVVHFYLLSGLGRVGVHRRLRLRW